MSTERLLRDAEAALRLALKELDRVTPVERALAVWILGEAPQASVDEPSRPLRGYNEIACAAMVEQFAAVEHEGLTEGLRWLTSASLVRSGLPAPVATDTAAQLLIALAVSRRPALQPWFAEVSQAGVAEGTPAWLRGAGALVVGAGPEPDVPPEMRLALAGRGFGATTEADEEALLELLISGSLATEPVRAAFQLAALRWVRRSAPVVQPGRVSVGDLLELLSGVQPGLAEWTWETIGRKRGAEPVRWEVSSEYHVQSLLWLVLRPVFPDLRKEEYVPSAGHHQPRTDLLIPSLGVVIEVKYLSNGGRAAWRKITEELKADVIGYTTSDSPASRMVVVLWDGTASTEQHETFRQGFDGIDAVEGVVVLSRPGRMTAAP